VIPPLPKKSEILPKPDVKVIKEKEQKNVNRIQDLINKKVQFNSFRKRSELKSSNSTEKTKDKEITNMKLCKAK